MQISSEPMTTHRSTELGIYSSIPGNYFNDECNQCDTSKQLMIEIVYHPVLFANLHHGGLPA